jgi:SAM-dependent methyltransferase
MASFFRTYRDRFPKAGGMARVLEIGSKTYEGQPTYRALIDDHREKYTGLDLEDGQNVDVVAKSGYVWPEFADDSFDVCISGQTFEHNPFFWVTMAEIARVLAPGGYACIIAPGGGIVHRYPLDCWRYYPDSWAALCALTGLEPVEVYFEPDDMAVVVVDGEARDSLLIARKPEVDPAEVKERRRQLVEPFNHGFGAFEPVMHKEGPCIEDYRRTVRRGRGWRAMLANMIAPRGPVRIYDPAAMQAP